MTGPIINPDLGDRVYLGSFLSRNDIWGVVSDIDTPDQASMSWEVAGGNGYITVPVLQGKQGARGSNAPVPDLQLEVFDDPSELPTNLTDQDVDIGKYWVVREFDDDGDPTGSKVYIWYGDHYEWFQMGTEGPPGPVPIISFSIELLDPDDPDLDNQVVITGDAFHPSVLLRIKAPRGPQGVMGDMEDITNFDGSSPSQTGDVPTFNEATNKWEPKQTTFFIPKFYTFPENSFTNVALAFGARVPIGTAVLPPQVWDCVPYVQGHFRLGGLELDATPFMLGIEVRVGAPDGTLIARGWGTASEYTYVIPHASESAHPANAITPDNERGLIPAGSTGPPATLYINAFNDGVSGVYHFNNQGAQLAVLLMPV